MPSHKLISFNNLHKAKLNNGLAIDRDITPEGDGDNYWATDTKVLSLSVPDGETFIWEEYDLSLISAPTLTLDDLTNVYVPTPTNGQVLTYVTSNSRWEAVSPSTPVSALTDLSDVTISGAAKGNLLVRTASEWLNMGAGTNGQVLSSDSAEAFGLKWINNDFSTANAPYVTMENRTIDPGSSPSSGYAFFFVKNDALYIKLSSGTVIGPIDDSIPAINLDDLGDVVITSAVKGEILIHNGTNWIDVEVGVDGEVLTANSGAAAGVSWETAAGGTDNNAQILLWLGLSGPN